MEEILKQLDPALRQRVEADAVRLAPFLGLLAAWKAAIEEHIGAIEQKVAHRLMEQFLPLGEWRFPAQVVAVPQDLRYREIAMGTTFTDPFTGASYPFTGAPWIPCGSGWTLPSKIIDWSVVCGSPYNALVLNVHYEGSGGDARLLTPEQAQLMFVGGSEALVAALAKAHWAIQYPVDSFEPITVLRYEGYLEMERELGVARLTHRHLEAWLPPFYPYSRRFLQFSLPAPDNTPPVEAWAWLGSDNDSIRLVALIDDATARLIEEEDASNLFILNAIPLAQMGVLSQTVVAPLHAVGDSIKVTFAAVADFFAAAARADSVVQRARFTRTPTEVPHGFAPRERALYDVHVVCDQSATEVKLYHGCLGEEAHPGRDRPEYLTRPGGQQFSMPLPSVGGMNLSVNQPSDEGARYFWYHAMFRPAMLTEADVKELLRYLPSVRAFFDMEAIHIQLDTANNPWEQLTVWDSYLYPSVASGSDLLTIRANYLARSRFAIVPVVRLWFQPRRDAPRFLLEEAARHAASVLSQYFMTGWYRVEGCVRW